MIGRCSLALLVVCGILASAATAVAQIPDPGMCIVPSFIRVVGYSGTTPDARGTFLIELRDIGNYPIPYSLVSIEFGNCTDMRLCKDFRDSVDCPTAVVRKLTDANGDATFTIVGGAKNSGASPGPGLGCVTIRGNNVLIGTATAVVLDENGALGGSNNGVTASDFVPLLRDWGAGTYFGRSDFNLSGPPVITAADFVPWLKCWGDGGSVNGCTTTYCPQ